MRHMASMPGCLSHLPDVNLVAPKNWATCYKASPGGGTLGAFLLTSYISCPIASRQWFSKCGSPVLHQCYFPGNTLKIHILGLTSGLLN